MRMILLLLLLVPMTAAATNRDVMDQRQSQTQTQNATQSVTQGNTQTVGDTVVNAGDMNVGGDEARAYAFSHSLGDVDINDCLASVQWGTIIVSAQTVKLNKWCAAEIYDAKGLFHMAAVMRCDIKEIAKHFKDQETCVVANTITAPPVHNPVQTEDCDDECEEEFDGLVARLTALEQQRQEDAERAQRAARAAQRAKEAAKQVEPGITEAQRQALAEVFKQ